MLKVYIFSGSFIISYLNGAVCPAYTGDISILHIILKFSKQKQPIRELAFTSPIFYDVIVDNHSVHTILTLVPLEANDVKNRASHIRPHIDERGNVEV